MAVTLKRIKQLDKLTSVPNTVDLIVNKTDGTTMRAELSDVLSLANIPKAALDNLVKVADETAIMYVVVDDTKLNQAAGYQEYKAGTAAKATADESGNNIKSNYASSLEISNGNIVLKNKNGTALSTEALPSTVGTFYGTCSSAANAQQKVATVTNNDFALEDGATIVIKFTYTNSYESSSTNPITLNVNNTGAKSIIVASGGIPTGDNKTVFGTADYYNTYVYDGTYWVWQSCSSLATGLSTTFIGTMAEWNALSSAQKELYDVINITDDTLTDKTCFEGTMAQWNALSQNEKDYYEFVCITDDNETQTAYNIPYNSNNVGDELDNINTALTWNAYTVADTVAEQASVTTPNINNYRWVYLEMSYSSGLVSKSLIIPVPRFKAAANRFELTEYDKTSNLTRYVSARYLDDTHVAVGCSTGALNSLKVMFVNY